MVARASFKKDARRYRYYVSRAIVEGRRELAGEVRFVPAHVIEPLLLSAVAGQAVELLDQAAKAVAYGRDRPLSSGAKVSLGWLLWLRASISR